MGTRRAPSIVTAATAYSALAAQAEVVLWEGPITFEGQVTGDGRLIEHGALTWPEDFDAEPLPFRYVGSDIGAHDGAVNVGRILGIERRPKGVIWAHGDIVLDSEAAHRAVAEIRDGRKNGVSVDLDDIAFEVRIAADVLNAETEIEEESVIVATAGADPSLGREYEVVVEIKPDDEVMATTSARTRGATLVDIPAFAGARVSIIEPAAVVEEAEEIVVEAIEAAATEPATGAIVALLPAASDPIVAASSQLAHVTMAYLGEAADLPAELIARIHEEVGALAVDFTSIDATPESRGTLGESEADVVYVRSDGLNELHDAVAREGSAVAEGTAPDAFPFNPHVTLGYPDEPAREDYDTDAHESIRFDRLAVWIGEDRKEYPLKGGSDDAETTDDEEVVVEVIEASAAPLAPPREWFADPKLTGPTPLRIDDDGRVYGHMATWNECHIGGPSGEGVCVTAPHSESDYARFHTGTIKLADGGIIDIGRLTMGTGHAGPRANGAAAAAHYDNTGTAVADVRAGEDVFGIWVAGGLRPEVTPEQVRALRSSPISGDWRREPNGAMEMRAALAVNVPGFPIPRVNGLVASGELQSLTAAGVIVSEETVDAATEPGAQFSATDLAYLERAIAREKAAEVAALSARVNVARASANRKKIAAFVAARR